MKYLFKRSLLTTTLLSLTLAATAQSAPTPKVQEPNGHWVGGYYSSWSYWRGGKQQAPSLDQIVQQAGHANFIDYAFLAITTSKTISDDKPTYGGLSIPADKLGKPGSVIDIEAVADNLDGQCPGSANDPAWCAASHIYSYLNTYAKADSGKTVLMASIGGWSYTHRFTEFYQDYTKNKNILNTFLDSTIAWLKAHPQFSGIDIDWEYPGWGQGETQKGHQGEGKFYTSMITQLRTRLNQLGKEKGKHYYLTSAIVASAKKAAGEAKQGVNWQAVANNVDWFNVMTFDENGEWNIARKNPQALSMDSPKGIKQALNYYLNTAKIPSQKLLLGLPLYGREMLVANKPSESTNYGYGGSLQYPHYQQFYDNFKNTYYETNPTYFDFQDNPNAEAYYPVGGMADFTGGYDYRCFIGALTNNKVQGECPLTMTMDNRGNLGQPLPQLTITSVKPGVAWAYGGEQSVKANFTNTPYPNYQAYPVFTLDTPNVIKYKINKIVKKDHLGGAWFWELTEDSLTQPKYSLFAEACKDLGAKGKCIMGTGPGPQPKPGKVQTGACTTGESSCLDLSNNSGHPSDAFKVQCDDGKQSYDFGSMTGSCNDNDTCMKHIELPQTCHTITVTPTGAGVCTNIQVNRQGISTRCDVNTETCACHAA